MASYFGTSINESPTIVLPAAEKIENAQAIALAIKEGGVGKPTAAGDMLIGLTLRAAEETYEKGDDVTIQVKDIGKWTAGEAIAIGDLLTANTAGKAVKATAGNFIMAIALTATKTPGTMIQVQIIKAGYVAAAAGDTE